MANPKPITIKITGDADSLEKEIARARAQLDKLEDSVEKQSASQKRMSSATASTVDKIRDFSSELTSGLGPASGIADKAVNKVIDGIQGIGPVAGAAVAGLGLAAAGIGAFAAESVQAFVGLGEQVYKFSLATGLSAESSSVLVDAFDDLGIGADTGQSALARLSKSAVTNKDALADLGVQVAYNKDGSLDLWGTLGNVAEAMSTSTDQAKTAAIGNAAFGKSWASLMPLLEGGRAGLADAADEAENLGIVLSGQDAQAAHDFNQAMVSLNDGLDGLKLSVGRDLVPQLTGFVNILTKAEEAMNKVRNSGDLAKGFFEGLTGPLGLAAKLFGDSGDKAEEAAQKVDGNSTAVDDNTDSTDENTASKEEAAAKADLLKAATDRTTDAIRRAEQADKDRKQAQDDLTNAVVASADSELNYEKAERNTIKALDDQHTSETKLSDAVRDHGASSDEAKAASGALADQTINTKEAILRQADAAVASAQHNAELGGSSLDAGQKAATQRSFLEQLAQTLEPGSALRSWLEGYIGQLYAIPSSRTTDIYVQKHYVDIGGVVDTGGVALASGGPLNKGVPALVGEEGPELIMPTGDGFVFNASDTKSMLSGSASSGTSSVNVGGGGPTINIYAGMLGTEQDLIRWVQEGLRRYDSARKGSQ